MDNDDRRSGIDRRVALVESAIAKFGSDLNDIKYKQELQKTNNENQFNQIRSHLDKISTQLDTSEKKIDSLFLSRAAIQGGINLLKFIGYAGAVAIFAWIAKAIFWGRP